VGGTGDKSPVFVTWEKSVPEYQSMRKQIERLAVRAGISHPITPHTFRHSRITHLIQEGVNESVIKLMM
jgi:site-specific recombinase XerD